MAIVVRLGPLPLGRRRASRVAELERIFATAVEVIEVIDVTRLASAIAVRKVAAVALDAPGPEDLADAITAAGPRPVLRPLWKQERNSRGEVDDVFDGYGLFTADGVETPGRWAASGSLTDKVGSASRPRVVVPRLGPDDQAALGAGVQGDPLGPTALVVMGYLRSSTHSADPDRFPGVFQLPGRGVPRRSGSSSVMSRQLSTNAPTDRSDQ